MAAPFFSVIIPTYNRAHILGKALESVRAQSFQDFEVLVVDDGSKDDPREIVQTFGDPRIRIIICQDNAGGGAARNVGIDQARGRFVALLDSDDAFLPHHLTSMHALLEGTQGLVGYARVRVDRGGDRLFLKPPRAIRPGEDMATYLLCDRGFTPTSTLVVPREAAAKVRFDEHLRVAEDTDFAIRLASAGYRFAMLEKPGAVWQDEFDANRLSASSGDAQFNAWLSRLRSQIPTCAWHGARGWAYAKLIVDQHRLLALGLYLNAVTRGCYRPSLAVVVGLQVFLGPKGYRRLADHAISRLRLGLREGQAKTPAHKLGQA
jgi:cellulose synthase/poly-beta-1,6-N-acetylglucosamine synthase-like glycosyltransferase